MKSTFSQQSTPSRHNLTKQPCSLVNTVRSLVNKESQRHSAVHSTLALNKHRANEIAQPPEDHRGEHPSQLDAQSGSQRARRHQRRYPGEGAGILEGREPAHSALPLALSAQCPLLREEQTPF